MAKVTVLIHATRAIALLLSHPPSPRNTAIANCDANSSTPPSTRAAAPPRPQAISITSGEEGGGAGGGGRGALGARGAGGKVSRELEALLASQALLRPHVDALEKKRGSGEGEGIGVERGGDGGSDVLERGRNGGGWRGGGGGRQGAGEPSRVLDTLLKKAQGNPQRQGQVGGAGGTVGRARRGERENEGGVRRGGKARDSERNGGGGGRGLKGDAGREGRGREGHDENEEGLVEREESDGGLALLQELTTDFFLQ